MSGTTTSDPARALRIPFRRVFTIVELDGAGCVVINNTASDGGKAFGASDLNEAIQVVQGWADAPPPAAPTITAVTAGGQTVQVGSAPAGA